MKAKKIYKTLKYINNYCSFRECESCIFHNGSCMLENLPIHWDMSEIKKAVEQMK